MGGWNALMQETFIFLSHIKRLKLFVKVNTFIFTCHGMFEFRCVDLHVELVCFRMPKVLDSIPRLVAVVAFLIFFIE